MRVRRFEELEHTADLGIRVFGADLAELLTSAAEGMFSLIGSAAFRPEELRSLEISIESHDPTDLLVLWLQRLLREFNLSGFFLTACDVRATPAGCSGTVRGGTFDPRRHEFRSEIKGVTFHGLAVASIHGGWQAQVIFDV